MLVAILAFSVLYLCVLQLLDKVERRVHALEAERRLLRRSAHTSKADQLALEGECMHMQAFNDWIEGRGIGQSYLRVFHEVDKDKAAHMFVCRNAHRCYTTHTLYH